MADREEKIESAEINTSGNKLIKKIDNFFYHYKWHTAVVAFILIIAIVCSVQMCQREEYDVYVLYAGGYSVSKTAEGGDMSEYVSIMSEIKGVSADFDGDGKISDEELRRLANSDVKISRKNGAMELLSTHPDSLKRVKRLAELEN